MGRRRAPRGVRTCLCRRVPLAHATSPPLAPRSSPFSASCLRARETPANPLSAPALLARRLPRFSPAASSAPLATGCAERASRRSRAPAGSFGSPPLAATLCAPTSRSCGWMGPGASRRTARAAAAAATPPLPPSALRAPPPTPPLRAARHRPGPRSGVCADHVDDHPVSRGAAEKVGTLLGPRLVGARAPDVLTRGHKDAARRCQAHRILHRVGRPRRQLADARRHASGTLPRAFREPSESRPFGKPQSRSASALGGERALSRPALPAPVPDAPLAAAAPHPASTRLLQTSLCKT